LEDAVFKAPFFQNATPQFRERSRARSPPDATRCACLAGGILYAAGTDSNLITVSTEVAALVKIGMPPMDGDQSGHFSRAVHWDWFANGSIRPGFEADLLVINTDPLGDITALQKVVLVINDGEIAIDKFRK
jgi:imidazolonepropionase-like amidohydrolase